GRATSTPRLRHSALGIRMGVPTPRSSWVRVVSPLRRYRQGLGSRQDRPGRVDTTDRTRETQDSCGHPLYILWGPKKHRPGEEVSTGKDRIRASPRAPADASAIVG